MKRSYLSSAVVGMVAGSLTGVQALAAEWTPSLSLAGTATFTDNSLLRPKDQAESDIILSVSPTIGVRKDGARLKVNGRYTPNFYTYVAGTASSEVRNTLNGTASLEAVENLFFIDARALIYQTFLSPFGPQPADQASSTTNRVESRTLGLSPYIRGRLAGGSQYLLRDDVTYTTFAGTNRPDMLGHAVSAKWDGRERALLVPSAEYNLYSTQFGGQQPYVSQTARGRGTVNINPEFQVFATGGYERNDFVFSQQEGAIYGGGFHWKPSPRTDISANAEKRFFGTSYDVDARYRTALTSWSLRSGRRLQTTQQQAQQVGAAGARATLDALLAPSIPDPVERAAAIDRILAQGGLGASLAGPSPLYTPRILLVESLEPSIAILGARSTITFSAFWRKTTPLSEAVATNAADVFANLSTITQRGGSIVVTHKIDPLLTGDASATRMLTNGTPTVTGSPAFETWQSIFRVGLSRRLDPMTFGTVGLRWQVFNSNPFGDYRERAVVFSVTHTYF